jgi:hypothetical protein
MFIPSSRQDRFDFDTIFDKAGRVLVDFSLAVWQCLAPEGPFEPP